MTWADGADVASPGRLRPDPGPPLPPCHLSCSPGGFPLPVTGAQGRQQLAAGVLALEQAWHVTQVQEMGNDNLRCPWSLECIYIL